MILPALATAGLKLRAEPLPCSRVCAAERCRRRRQTSGPSGVEARQHGTEGAHPRAALQSVPEDKVAKRICLPGLDERKVANNGLLHHILASAELACLARVSLLSNE